MRKMIPVTICMLLLTSFCLYGQTWSPIIRLTWNVGASFNPAIVRNIGNCLHLVWQDSSFGGNYEIYYKRSTNGGITWSAVRRLTWTSGNSLYPAVAIDSADGVHVVWNDGTPGEDEVYYKRSTNGGTTWSTAKRLTWSRTTWDIQMGNQPTIAADSGNGIYVAWDSYESGNYEIYFKRSTDKGQTWSARQRLTWTSGWTEWPDIAVDINDHIHIVWSDGTPGNGEIFYKRSSDGGVTWSVLKRLTWSINNSAGPKTAADLGGGIHVVWNDACPDPDQVIYKNSLDGGTSWSAPTQLTWTSDWSWYPEIAALDTGVHVVWREVDPDDGNISQIRYKSSPDLGSSWGTTVQLTWNNKVSAEPSVTVDISGAVHIVWYDYNPGNYEIYYKYYK